MLRSLTAAQARQAVRCNANDRAIGTHRLPVATDPLAAAFMQQLG